MEPLILLAVLLPFFGTGAGAAFVFFLRNSIRPGIQRILAGFAAGVMVAASVWSLLLPAIEQSTSLGWLAFLPAGVGVWAGFLFLMALDRSLSHALPHRCSMMVLAVALHNLPEGMAVGVVAAGYMAGLEGITAFSALTLAFGIAVQNLPEGAIISMPLRSEGMSRPRAFGCGVLSGVIEPIGALATILLARWVIPVLPMLLGFSAGAMLYVVVENLVPDMGQSSRSATAAFAFGFTLMMALDVALS